tara:strand:- start:1047 stop:1889 length:843 start_codon:yes stop_codon:yes gene_type:complete
MADEQEAVTPETEAPAPEAAETPKESSEGGLLEDVKLATSEPEAVEDEINHVDEESDGKPDWLPERFWDDDKGADYEGLAKSQDELYKKLRGGKHQAPENGEYNTNFLDGAIPEDDPLLSKFKEVAVDRGLTQDDFETIVGMVKDNMGEAEAVEEAEAIDRQAELSKLGPNAEEIIGGHVKWAQSMVDKGVWNEDHFEEFKVWGGTANGIKALSKLREFYGETPVPLNVSPDSGDIPTEDDLQAMIADPRYPTDASYRQKVYNMLQKMDPNAEGHMPTLG